MTVADILHQYNINSYDPAINQFNVSKTLLALEDIFHKDTSVENRQNPVLLKPTQTFTGDYFITVEMEISIA
jgi:hypothetical protein